MFEVNGTADLPNEVKARFVKDFDLPIQVVKHPYFDYYIDLLDSQYKTKAKLEMFLDALKKFGTENFFKASSQFVDGIIAHIKAKPGYTAFTQMDMGKFTARVSMQKGELYQEANSGHQFISFDLKQANFSSLRFVNPEIFDNKTDFVDFAKGFTDSNYFLSSKKLRQVIFGNLSPSRQQTVQRYLVSILYQYLLNAGLGAEDIKTSNSDEIVIQADTSKEDTKDFINKIVLPDIDFKQLFSTDVFSLSKIGTEKYHFFCKWHETSLMHEIKGVPAAYIPEAIKFMKFSGVYESQMNEADRFFFQDGRLCAFKTPLF